MLQERTLLSTERQTIAAEAGITAKKEEMETSCSGALPVMVFIESDMQESSVIPNASMAYARAATARLMYATKTMASVHKCF